jgi:uncharacterized protein (DUF1778 family)
MRIEDGRWKIAKRHLYILFSIFDRGPPLQIQSLRPSWPTFVHIAKMWEWLIIGSAEDRMSRISIDVTDDEHKKLKAMAALRGKSIKDFVLERTLIADEADDNAMRELEKLLDRRIRTAQAGAVSRQTTSEIFTDVTRKRVK